MGRKIQYNDDYHVRLREQIRKTREKYKDVFKPLIQPVQLSSTTFKELIKKEPDIYTQKDSLPLDSTRAPAQISERITSLVQSMKCAKCSDAVGCNEPCEEFMKLCAYEHVKSQQGKP